MGFKLMLFTICVSGMYVSFDVIEKMMGGVAGDIHQQRNLLCTQGELWSKLSFWGMPSRVHRMLCEVSTELDQDTFENVFGTVSTSYSADGFTETPEGDTNVAFVVTIQSCPETGAYPRDPGDAFYDAAAVLRDSVCNCTATNPDSGSNYNSTLYAVIHPDAVMCEGPSTAGGERRLQSSYMYDRVAILQELGYWVIIWREPVSIYECNDI